MTIRLLSIDPGLSTGIALLEYGTSAPELKQAWQISGGAEGLTDWLWRGDVAVPPADITIVEKFNARHTGNFSYTTASLEPLRCEGVLIRDAHNFYDLSWVQPPQQYLVGGKDLADKKKRQHRFLKESGFYVTGKDVGQKDADDVRSAMAHGLAYLMRDGHKPTYNLVSEWTEKIR